MHRFLRWFPVWALGTAVSFVALAIAAAQVWPGAKHWDEAQRDKVLAVMSAPLFWLIAVLVVALWAYVTWHTRPTRKPAVVGNSGTVDTQLTDILARRKAEFIADVIAPPRDGTPERRLKPDIENLHRETLKRCPEMPMWKAVEYVRGVIGDDNLHGCYSEARRQIRQAALENRLEIWGRKEIPPVTMSTPLGASGAWSKIEPDYWNQYELSSLAVGEHFEQRDHTWNEAFKNEVGQRYWELRVRKAQVERLWRKDNPEARVPPEGRSLIASGRDLVQRYRDDGMPEPFGAFVLKHRPYLDIQPHLGDEFVREALRRNDRPDTAAARDYDSAMFLRELARLEKEWSL